VHRHRSLWDNPDAFDPERFRPEAVKARHRYAYLPFGAGPRICIGASFAMLEAVAILATVLQSNSQQSMQLSLPPGFEPSPRLRITLRPQGGLPMQLARVIA
jgi:cytochrome P450